MATKLTSRFSAAVREATQKQIDMRSKESLKFFRQYVAKKLNAVNTLNALTEVNETNIVNSRRGILPGEIICFNYDPKFKDKLPYYDKTPLIIPISANKTGFSGLNLHYLKPVDRARLMDLIFKHDKSVLGYMHALAQSPYYAPCYKKYLYSRMRSKVHIFSREHWEIAIYLPLARFVKASQGLVGSKSKRMIKRSTQHVV